MSFTRSCNKHSQWVSSGDTVTSVLEAKVSGLLTGTLDSIAEWQPGLILGPQRLKTRWWLFINFKKIIFSLFSFIITIYTHYIYVYISYTIYNIYTQNCIYTIWKYNLLSPSSVAHMSMLLGMTVWNWTTSWGTHCLGKADFPSH